VSSNNDALDKFKNKIKDSDMLNKFDKNPLADPNINYNIMEEILCNAKQECLPIKYVKFNKHKHKKKEWITYGIIKSINYKDKLYKTLINTPITDPKYDVLKTNLQTYKKILKKSIVQAKKLYYQNRFDTCNNNIRQTWQTIKEILNKTKRKELPKYFKIEQRETDDKTEIANHFNSYFANIGETFANSIVKPKHTSYKQYLTTPCTEKLEFKPIDNQKVEQLIDQMKLKTSTGYDNLSSKLIKYIKHEVKNALTVTINQSLKTGIFPQKLKLAKILPIYKNNDDAAVNNYRPIALLPVISKLFEMVIHEQINKHMIINKLYYEHQYGFKQGHSTELASLELIDVITDKLDQGKLPFAVFLDLSKAFDTINHDILLNKLEYYGITGTANNLLKSYLRDRTQYVEFDSAKSNTLNNNIGVPQGSILGPLLFTIYINDIANSSNIFKLIAYADDTTLISTIDKFNIENLENSITYEINKISDWLKVNKLSINPKKSKFMIFHLPQRKINYFKVQINGKDIERLDNFNFLGLIINKNLGWKSHTDVIATKVSKSIGIINRLKYTVSQSILKTLYTSLILPYLYYSILAWGHNPGNLVQLQKKAIRIISNIGYVSHTEPKFKTFSLLKVEDIYKSQLLKFYFKSMNNSLPVYFENFLSNQIKTIHNYEMRGRIIQFPKISHEFAKYRIRYTLVELINNTPMAITEKIFTHSFQGFNTYCKKAFINKYQLDCSINQCYVCRFNT
jgi:hypothetical protein